MAVRGINPSYFAGMPTVQRDPRAGQVDPSFAAMPGQALSEANAMNQRRHEFDSGEAFRAKELALRTDQEARSNTREDSRLAMYQQGEDRRQAQQDFENDRLKAADTRKLVEALQNALDEGETGIAEALAAELKSRGWGVKPLTSQAPGSAEAMPDAQPGAVVTDTAQEPPTSVSPAIHNLAGRLRGQLSENQATGPAITNALGGGAKRPQSAGDADLSTQLDAAEGKYMGALTKNPTSEPMSYEAAMQAAKQSGALGVKQVPGGWQPIVEGDDDKGVPYQAQPRRGLLPGRSMRKNVAQSNAMLSPDDPLNKIVQ